MIQLSPSMAGLTVVATLVVLLATGMPIAFALGLSAIGGLLIANGFGVFEVLAETMFAGIASVPFQDMGIVKNSVSSL